MSTLYLYFSWFFGLGKTAARTLGAFWNHRLGPFLPIVTFLLLWAIVLWLINSISPLAPFVYSLI
jgi:hypothetical protein